MKAMAAAMKSLDVEDALAAKIERFREMVETQMNEVTAQRHTILHDHAVKAGRRGYTHVVVDGGKRRFVKVWAHTNTDGRHRDSICIKYFVEVETEKIYGARSIAAYNPARCYGTLDTIDEWFWGEYYASHRTNMDRNVSLVPIAERV